MFKRRFYSSNTPLQVIINYPDIDSVTLILDYTQMDDEYIEYDVPSELQNKWFYIQIKSAPGLEPNQFVEFFDVVSLPGHPRIGYRSKGKVMLGQSIRTSLGRFIQFQYVFSNNPRIYIHTTLFHFDLPSYTRPNQTLFKNKMNKYHRHFNNYINFCTQPKFYLKY